MDTAMYKKLHDTASSFMRALLPLTPGTVDFKPEAILSHLDSSFRMDWGHSFFVTTMPGLQGEKTGESFTSHMSGMAQTLQTWSIDITNVCVDEKDKSVVIRADFHMVPKGGEEVLNDLIFWMKMDETGEKLVKCTEFIDPVATKELGARMKAAAEKPAK